MNYKIPEAFISEVKKKLDIVDVIGEYLSLTKKGSSYKAVCPFHQDNNPSLSISPNKQIYRCFSCGAAGNVITFVMKYNNITFYEAVKELAAKAGLAMPASNHEEYYSEASQKSLRLQDLNNAAADYFSNQLQAASGAKAYQYLKSRQIQEDTMEAFRLGYAPARAGNKLIAFLLKAGYSEVEIEAVGLINISNNQTQLCFEDAIMIPIRNHQQAILGFSARSMQEHAYAKYINTKETELFHKKTMIYNIDQAYDAIKQQQKVILVEGYFDVIALFQQGITNTVALMGTYLSQEQITVLKKLTNHVVLFMDGDVPGWMAQYKLHEQLTAVNFKVSSVVNKTTLDPDQLVRSLADQAAVATLVAQTASVIDNVLNYYPNLKQIARQRDNRFLEMACSLIGKEQDQEAQKSYLKKLALLSGTSTANLQVLVRASQYKQGYSNVAPQESHAIKSEQSNLSLNSFFKNLSLRAVLLYWQDRSWNVILVQLLQFRQGYELYKAKLDRTYNLLHDKIVTRMEAFYTDPANQTTLIVSKLQLDQLFVNDEQSLQIIDHLFENYPLVNSFNKIEFESALNILDIFDIIKVRTALLEEVNQATSQEEKNTIIEDVWQLSSKLFAKNEENDIL